MSRAASIGRFLTPACAPAPRTQSKMRKSGTTLKMREILTDWLIDVCREYSLSNRTLFIAVAMLDRLLARRKVEKRNLQLAGIVCVFSAHMLWRSGAERVEGASGTDTLRMVQQAVYLCDSA